MFVIFTLVTGFRCSDCIIEYSMLFIGDFLFFLHRLGKDGTNIDEIVIKFFRYDFSIFNDTAIIQFEFWLTFIRLMPVDNIFKIFAYHLYGKG